MSNAKDRRWLWYGWLGLALVGIFWALNWSLTGLRTQWCFFPMWLGYCLVLDALTRHRTGTSVIRRSPQLFWGLFLVSAPSWWLFEFINLRLQSWLYLGRQISASLPNILLDSLNFSVVMPATFITTELVASFGWISRFSEWRPYAPGRTALRVFFAAGLLLLALALTWPGYFFLFIWLALYFIFEPLNKWLGSRTIISHVAAGDWRPVLSLGLGCLIAGFFWELWNFYSYPKWIYQVPFIDFWHVFEMPLLGYLGYLPFSLELFALYHLVIRLAGAKSLQASWVVQPPA